jgi:hypothetical protein
VHQSTNKKGNSCPNTAGGGSFLLFTLFTHPSTITPSPEVLDVNKKNSL